MLINYYFVQICIFSIKRTLKRRQRSTRFCCRHYSDALKSLICRSHCYRRSTAAAAATKKENVKYNINWVKLAAENLTAKITAFKNVKTVEYTRKVLWCLKKCLLFYIACNTYIFMYIIFCKKT